MQGKPTTEPPKNQPPGTPAGKPAEAKSAEPRSAEPRGREPKTGGANKTPGAVAVAPSSDRTSFWKRLRRNRAIVDPRREDAVLVKLDAVEEKLGAFEKRLAAVEERVVKSIPEYTRAVGEELSGSVSKGIGPLDQRIQALESSVGAWVGSLEEKLRAHEGAVSSRLEGLEGQLSRVLELEDKLGGITEVRDLSKKLRAGQQALDERTRSQGVGIIGVTVIALIAAAGTVALLLEEMGILDF